jgi:pyruvate/2-oxoglutarate/acetoin dehydrogenase E1 component
MTMNAQTPVRELTFNQAVNEAIRQEMRRDPTVIILGEDINGAAGRTHLGLAEAWGGPLRATRGLFSEFGPERVLDTPISEMGFMGAAVGAAMTGLRPIVELMFVDLIGCCYDQIMNQAAKMRYMMGGQIQVPLVIRIPYGTHGGPYDTDRGRPGYGGGAGAQHSQTLYSVLAHIPGLKVVVPSSAYSAKGLMIAAIRDNDPVVVMEHKALGSAAKGLVPEEPYTLSIGRAAVVRSGKDITLCGIGRMTLVCLAAAEKLAGEGIDAEVVDVLSLAPLDEAAILESVERTRRLVVVDEDTPTASMARDIAARAADRAFVSLDAPVKTVTSANVPVPFASVLEAHYAPRADQVIAAVREIVQKKPRTS